MKDCVFCKIIRAEIPAYKIYEDKEHIAFLDVQPNRAGQTLVIPKKHCSSNFVELKDITLKKLIIAAKNVSNQIITNFGAERCVLVIEGYGVSHAHIKLYPFAEGAYEGATSTALGPKANTDELERIAKQIRGEK